jgi:hypothetical protein
MSQGALCAASRLRLACTTRDDQSLKGPSWSHRRKGMNFGGIQVALP